MLETQRTIVISGASSGFGAIAVRAFADRGDRVWGTTRDVPTAMVAGFADMLASDQASDPQMVVDAYLSLAGAGA